MKIDFIKLLSESEDHLTIPQLAKDMAKEGLFKNPKSAYDMIHYHINGKAKACDWELLKYLCKRFNKKGTEIITWDN